MGNGLMKEKLFGTPAIKMQMLSQPVYLCWERSEAHGSIGDRPTMTLVDAKALADVWTRVVAGAPVT